MNPSKIVCVHLNYRSRVEEFGARLPKAPTYFLKPPSALIRSGEPVVRPRGCRYLNFEGEIVAVIGSRCRGIAPEDAGRFVAGYTIGNDFGLHDFRDTDAGSMLRVKGADTLCPCWNRFPVDTLTLTRLPRCARNDATYKAEQLRRISA